MLGLYPVLSKNTTGRKSVMRRNASHPYLTLHRCLGVCHLMVVTVSLICQFTSTFSRSSAALQHGVVRRLCRAVIHCVSVAYWVRGTHWYWQQGHQPTKDTKEGVQSCTMSLCIGFLRYSSGCCTSLAARRDSHSHLAPKLASLARSEFILNMPCRKFTLLLTCSPLII